MVNILCVTLDQNYGKNCLKKAVIFTTRTEKKKFFETQYILPLTPSARTPIPNRRQWV